MTRRPRAALNVLRLETRNTPAALFTYPDGDGDKVVVTTSKGTNAELAAAITMIGSRLTRLDLSNNAVFAGTNLSIVATRNPAVGGDGRVNIGCIDATSTDGGTSLDLGNVTIDGDLVSIDAGDAVPATPAIGSLTVQSMGRFIAGGDSVVSTITGAVGKLVVKSDVRDVLIEVNTFGADGKIGSLTVGGSIVGNSIGNTGQIFCSGDLGPVKIGHDVQGSTGSDTGMILAGGRVAGVTIGGSLLGGPGTGSGRILSGGDMGPVKIGGDVRGGRIFSNGKLANISLGGSLLGGSYDGAGSIETGGDMGPVKIGGDIVGADIFGSASLSETGYISGRRIASLSVGGSVRAGVDASTGSLTRNASVRAVNDIGPVTVLGGLIGAAHADGNPADGDFTPVIISARGQANLALTATSDLAIRSLTVGGNVDRGQVLAGYSPDLVPLNADAQIGSVAVDGDWIASDLVAGAVANGSFGDADDMKIAGPGTTDRDAIVSKIGRITVQGHVLGTDGVADQFGFVAQQIGSFKVGDTNVELMPGFANDLFVMSDFRLVIGETDDVRVLEIAL
jgi:hypothetical protein